MKNVLGFEYGITGCDGVKGKRTVGGACFRLQQYYPNYIFNDVSIDGKAVTLPDVQTILDGVTLGGGRVSDEIEIRNLKNSLDLLVHLVKNSKFTVDKATFCKLHKIAAKEEALVWGEFRSSGVSIAGTSFKQPPAESLSDKFNSGIAYINTIKNPLEKGIVLFLFSAFNQFFFDANKRVARLMMNGVLMSNGFDAIMIPAKDKNEFNLEMLKFYNTNNADSIMRFMLKCYNLNSANL